ncbi:MAG: DUF2249 domain-containing protein [Firmicutes bacterium]|nr:DUF2249 domain-containing protein [Bacillota bacterium]
MSLRSANETAMARMRAHHAQMVAQVRARVDILAARAAAPDGQAAATHTAADADAWREARSRLVDYARGELLPHARAEEGTIYAAAGARPEFAALVRAMEGEHRALAGLVDRLAAAAAPAEAARAAAGLEALFAAHAQSENDVILPPLAADGAVDLGAILERMHAALTPPVDVDAGAARAEADVELDVREIPHPRRHTLIAGVVRHLRPGQALILTVDHDPLPLRRQLEAEHGQALVWQYDADGPDVWRVRVGVDGR